MPNKVGTATAKPNHAAVYMRSKMSKNLMWVAWAQDKRALKYFLNDCNKKANQLFYSDTNNDHIPAVAVFIEKITNSSCFTKYVATHWN